MKEEAGSTTLISLHAFFQKLHFLELKSQLGVVSAPTEDPGFPPAPIWWLSNTCNNSSGGGGSEASSADMWCATYSRHTHVHMTSKM